MNSLIPLNLFILRPSVEAWENELRLGWSGPDGSSMSTDTICGVKIGKTSTSYIFIDLPANRHDWYYRLGRRLHLPEPYRVAADKVYRDFCIRRCRVALRGGPLGSRKFLFPVAYARAHARYATLRIAARFAWTQKAKARREAWGPNA